jgi:Tfp pilus assembly protein PilN
MTEIDFLPSEYWKRRQSQRDQWYLLAIGLAALFPLLSSFLHESKCTAQLQRESKEVESAYRNALAQVEEVERLKKQSAPIAVDVRFYSLLRARPSLSRTMTVIATSCPPRVTLNAIRVRPSKIARTDTKPPGSVAQSPAASGTAASDSQTEQLERFAAERESTRLAIELVGIAESDLDVADLIERLESAGCFKEVNLSTVDYQPSGLFELREFKIQCRLTEVL